MSLIRESHIRYGSAHRSYLTTRSWLVVAFIVGLLVVIAFAISAEPELYKFCADNPQTCT